MDKPPRKPIHLMSQNQSIINDHLPDDVVLRVSGVSKKFCRNLRRSMWYGIQDLAGNLLGVRGAGCGIRDAGYGMRDAGYGGRGVNEAECVY